MQMQPDELQQLQQRMVQLEQENTALQAQVALHQRELVLQAQSAQDRIADLATRNDERQTKPLLRQETENAVSESEYCRRAFEQAAIGMTMMDLDGRWLHMNQYFCDMVGYTEAELLALTFTDLTEPDTLVDDRALIQRLSGGELPAYQTEKLYRRKDGSWLWVSLTTSLVRDATGNPAYLISIVQDISPRKAAESIAQGQQHALQGTLALLANEPELDKFLGQVLSTIIEQLQAVVADIWLEDAEHTVATLHLSHWNVQLAPKPLVPFNPPAVPFSALSSLAVIARQIEERKQPFVYEDLPNHPDAAIFRNLSVVREGMQTMLIAPLLFNHDFLGGLVIWHLEHHAYSPESMRLITALSQQVVLALQLTRLAEEAKQVAIVEEQNRLAREIHDTLAQTFTGITLQLNNAQYYATQDAAIAWDIIEQVKTLSRSGLAESRRLVWSLHPNADEYRDVVGSLKRSLKQLTLHTSLQTNFVIVGTPQLVPPDVGMNLLRIGQEATTNTMRHAQAQTLQVEISFKADALTLRMQDDGAGFDVNSAHDSGGFGLLGMKQRCDRLGGQFTLYSQPGQGTCILVQFSINGS